jgi:hypothetical protein
MFLGFATETSYAYYGILPQEKADLISRVVEKFAAEKSTTRSSETWFHGLPIWVIREREKERVNKVQIEAVWAVWTEVSNKGPEPRISYTPDAYEDSVGFDSGLKKVIRQTASKEDILKNRQTIPLYDIDESKVRSVLTTTLDSAKTLNLGVKIPFEYATPFQ